MRFLKPGALAEEMSPPDAEFDDELQMAVLPGTGQPVIHSPQAWDRTTSGDLDGHKKPAEEWTMDYAHA